jgi:hypothetical protein
MIKLTIDPEFQGLIPALTTEERAQLEASLLAEGCRDPLVVWAGEQPTDLCPSCPPGTPFARATALIEAREGAVVWLCGFCDHGERRPWTLLDGHHCYPICQAHNLDFGIVEAPTWVVTREDVLIWIIQNQFSRRNLEPYQRAELALKLEPLIAAKAKAHQQQAGGAVPSKLTEALDTREMLAKMAGVSEGTMYKVKVIAQEADEPTKEALRPGERTIHHVYQDLRPPWPAPVLTDCAERDDGVKEANQKTMRLRLPSGHVKTVHEAQHDMQGGTSTMGPATGRHRAAQTPSSRTMEVQRRKAEVLLALTPTEVTGGISAASASTMTVSSAGTAVADPVEPSSSDMQPSEYDPAPATKDQGCGWGGSTRLWHADTGSGRIYCQACHAVYNPSTGRWHPGEGAKQRVMSDSGAHLR